MARKKSGESASVSGDRPDMLIVSPEISAEMPDYPVKISRLNRLQELR
ncbi:MAG: hypothetical protein RIC36_08850 [Rhodospirillales bacterium]